jgi:UDP-N-acetylglucosamine--N-acetylmuramyl-(pentapeptide) pyrophosphoryl-undecaprenol N-acetylglucosamine transferase
MSRGEVKGQKCIVLVGGGTGGHVVPLKYVARLILRSEESIRVLVVTDRGYLDRTSLILKDLKREFGSRLVVEAVFGGKFRRYGRGNLKELLDLKTQALNLRDLFKSLFGFVQSKILLHRYEPEVIFCKGGTGSLEFCFAARKKAPIVVHDSDSRPGMANKIVSRWAKVVLTGMPQGEGKVEDVKSRVIGIPVDPEFKPSSRNSIEEARLSLGIDKNKKTVLVTGGSLGAEKLNELIFCTLKSLNKLDVQVLHQTGSAEATLKARKLKKQLHVPRLYHPFDFSSEMCTLFAGSDIVVGRAGASALQELANSGKPAILIPAGLTDQRKNAKIMEEKGAALVGDQNDLLANPQKFISEVQYLLENANLRAELKEEIGKLARPDSAKEIVNEIFKLRSLSN